MAQFIEESGGLETNTVGIFRTAATVKGGRRFSFGALVVAGDREGNIGYGYAKAKEVPMAIEKAQKVAKRNMMKVPLVGTTIPHEVEGRHLACRVRLLPASPGTGVVSGASVRSVLELVGVTDALSKCYGSTNKLNVVKAVFDGLSKLRTKELVGELRGQDLGQTDIEERIERGMRLTVSTAPAKEEAAAATADGGDAETSNEGE